MKLWKLQLLNLLMSVVIALGAAAIALQHGWNVWVTVLVAVTLPVLTSALQTAIRHWRDDRIVREIERNRRKND